LIYLSEYADEVWEKYLEIVGVNKFKAVEAERDSLKVAASKLKVSLDEATRERAALSKKVGELEETLSKKKGKRKGLEVKLLEHEKSILGLEERVKSLKGELVGCKRDMARLESEKVMFEGKEITLKQLDEYVVAIYNKQIEQRAQERLGKLTSVVWPAWHERHHGEQVRLQAERMVNELARKQLWNGMFKALNDAAASKKSFQLTCDKCGTSFSRNLLPAGVEELARTGEVEIACPNQNCMDEQWLGPFRMGSSKHKFKIPSYEFLRQL